MSRTFLAAAILCCSASAASAAPIVLFRPEFAALREGRPVLVEDFRGFTEIGPQASPVQLINGTFTSPAPRILDDGETRYLADIVQEEFGTFADFPLGTVAWGATIEFPPFTLNHYDIIVEGSSGTLSLLEYPNSQFLGPPGFFAVYDPEGLQSVSIRSREPDEVYMYANITTVGIPEPSTIVLAGSAALATGLLGVRRYWKSRKVRPSS